MIKRIFVIFLLISVLFSFSACGRIEEYFDMGELYSLGPHISYQSTFEESFPSDSHIYIFHGKFVKIKRHLSKPKRAEYVFEVIEWFRGDNGKSKFSLFSSAEEAHYKSVMEYEEYHNGCDYVEGKKYLIIAKDSEKGTPNMSPEYYIPLEDLSLTNNGWYKVFFDEDTILSPDMTAEEFLDFIRTRVEENMNSEAE